MKHSFEKLFENLNRRFFVIIVMQIACVFGIFSFAYLCISVNQDFIKQFNRLTELRSLLRNNLIQMDKIKTQTASGTPPSNDSLAEFAGTFKELNNRIALTVADLIKENEVLVLLGLAHTETLDPDIKAQFFDDLFFYQGNAEKYVLSLVSMPLDPVQRNDFFWEERNKAIITTDMIMQLLQNKNLSINNRSRIILFALFGISVLIMGILNFFVFKPLFNQIKIENMNLTNAKREAEEARDVQTRFITNVSHEIRTPLTSILGFTDIGLMKKEHEIDHQQILSDIKKSAKHLESLINDVLDLSKIQIKDLKIVNQTFNINNIFHDIYSNFHMKAKKKSLDFNLQYLTKIPKEVESDSVRLTQIIMNLLENSLKYTPSGSIKMSVSFRPLQDGRKGLIHIEVEDTGIGINPKRQQDIFKWFYREQNNMMYKNTGFGIGLPLAKEMAESMGGRLKLVWSVEGRGSLFSLSMKITTHGDEYIEKFTLSDSEDALKVDFERFKDSLSDAKILLVEDGVENQDIIKFFLEYAGAKVLVEENGLSGLRAATEQDFDLVLMDLQMPVMDGYTAMLKLSELDYQKPVIALTAHAMRDEKPKCLNIGFTDYLTKPINVEVLLSTARQYIDGSLPKKLSNKYGNRVHDRGGYA